MALKDQIKKYRKLSGLTQEQLAQKIKVKKNTVSSWEQGLTTPEGPNRSKLCEIFDISESELFGGLFLAEPHAEYAATTCTRLPPEILNWLADPDVVEILSSPKIREGLRLAGKSQEKAKALLESCLKDIPNLSEDKITAIKAILNIGHT